jgi:hypothetical protein
MTEYSNLINNFGKKPTLCSLLQLLAVETWNRIEFSRTRKGLKIFETTITQNILFEFLKFKELFPRIPISMFEAHNEPVNGNDIELVIRTNSGYILSPLQAKIIYNSNKYFSMAHGNQINDLIGYANNIGGVPLYLLYNYVPSHIGIKSSRLCGIDYSKEQFGCSLISAHFLKEKFAFKRKMKDGNHKWKIPSFSDLHPLFAIPWFILGCCRNNSSDLDATINLLMNTKNIEAKSKFKIRSYTYNELLSDNRWKPMMLRDLDAIPPEIEDEDTTFKPKYRIVLNTDENAEFKKL